MMNLPKTLYESDVTPCELSKVYVRPTRVLWHNDKATGCENIIKNDDDQMLAGETRMIRDYCYIAPGGAVLVDYDKELCGGVKLFVKVMKNDKGEDRWSVNLRLRFGESANEAMADLGEKGTTNDHNPAILRCSRE